LEPFQYLNIAQIYSQYSTIFDFFIFLVLFVGLAQVVYEKRFQGRGGKAVIIAVGVSLAVGLSVAEAKFGFNLGSMGGIAGAILIIAFGLLLFHLLNSLGLQKSTAVAWTFIILFIFLNSISRKLAILIQRNFPILNLLFLLACLFAIIKGFSSLEGGFALKSSAKNLLQKGAEYARHIPLREEKLQKKGLRDEAKTIHQEIKISSKMVKQLYEIKGFIKEFGATEQGRKAIAEQIESLSANENKLLQKLGHLRDLDKQLEELDILAVRKLKEEYGKVPTELQAEIEKEIKAEKEKYKLSLKMEAFENRIKANVNGFNLSIRSCVEYLGKNHIFEAMQNIDKAIRFQMEIDDLLKEMDRIGMFMTGLTKREYKTMKKEYRKAA